MAYKALYRVFRPRRFSDVKGQDMVVNVLKNQVRDASPSHAYLFSGPRGTGKTSTARILATVLNCLNPQDGEPCLQCENCRAALSDSMIDIIEMDAASNNGVDNARDIRDKVALLPAKGKYKVYIIDEVHMLTNQAFNALLKTLEEPPAHVVFILATTEVDALPQTVLSRCQRFDFKYIDGRHIVDRMRRILREIGATAEDDALSAIAEASGGAMRDALTILEKCCSVSDTVTEQIVYSVLGYAEKSSLYRLFYAVADYDAAMAFGILTQILNAGIESSIIAAQILRGFEEMLFAAVRGEGKDPLMKELAEKFGKPGILRALDIFADAQNRMKFAPKPPILLEAALLRILLPESEENPAFPILQERMAKMEDRFADLQKEVAVLHDKQETVRPNPAPVKPVLAEKDGRGKEKNVPPVKKKAPAAAASPGPIWSWVLETYAADFSAKPILNGCTLLREEEGALDLLAANPMMRLMFENGGLKAEIQEKYKEAFGKNLRIRISEPEERMSGGLNGQDKVDIID